MEMSKLIVVGVLGAALSSLGMAAAQAEPLRESVCSQSYLPLPDPNCTPGATNPDVTQANISSTICSSGWTKTVRPPVAFTNALKVKQIKEYGYFDTSPSSYEEDHLIPLELGGAPRDPKNLWPQPRYGSQRAQDKDQIENKLKQAVCAHRTTLAKAQRAIASDWTTALDNIK